LPPSRPASHRLLSPLGNLRIYTGEFRQCAPAPLVRILTDAAVMPTVQLLLEYVHYTRAALRRNWRYSAAFFAAVMLLTLVGSFLLPRTYYSDARLFVRFGRTAVMDPTATAGSGQVVSLYDTRESELNSLLEVLRSRSLLERVVDAVGAENILAGRVSDTPDQKGPTVGPAAPSRDPRHQQALAKLEKSVSIAVPRKTSTIIIGCKAERPEIAQQIVAKLVAAYMDEHLRVHHTDGSHAFFQEQTKLLEQRWQAAVAKVRKAKDDWKILTFEGKRKNCETTIADIESKRLTAAAELSSSEARIKDLTASIASLPERIPTQSVNSPNAGADLMRQELYKVQSREQELLTKFSEKHPQVLAIRSTVVDLQKILAEQGDTRTAETTAVNPSRQSLELSLLNEQANSQALKSRVIAMDQQLKTLQGELHSLNARESQLASMQRDVDLAESRYRAYAEKLEQARINDQLDKERISNITLVQPASFVAKPGGPRKAYVLGLGFVVASLGSVGIALLAALLDPALRRLADIEELLRLPVLGTVRVGMA
jgi:polysaccharide biosynthesis protein PslE